MFFKKKIEFYCKENDLVDKSVDRDIISWNKHE